MVSCALENVPEESTTKDLKPGPVVRMNSVLCSVYIKQTKSWTALSLFVLIFVLCFCRAAQSKPARRKLFVRGECAITLCCWLQYLQITLMRKCFKPCVLHTLLHNINTISTYLVYLHIYMSWLLV